MMIKLVYIRKDFIHNLCRHLSYHMSSIHFDSQGIIQSWNPHIIYPDKTGHINLHPLTCKSLMCIHIYYQQSYKHNYHCMWHRLIGQPMSKFYNYLYNSSINLLRNHSISRLRNYCMLLHLQYMLSTDLNINDKHYWNARNNHQGSLNNTFILVSNNQFYNFDTMTQDFQYKISKLYCMVHRRKYSHLRMFLRDKQYCTKQQSY